eukprot:1161904-Pelagomonas_calceolata.AAC.10
MLLQLAIQTMHPSLRASSIALSLSLPNIGILWTPGQAPRTPQIMLLMKCMTITAGQASQGAAFCGNHFGRPGIVPAFWCPQDGYPPAQTVCAGFAQIGPVRRYSKLRIG